ncbi:hypothetical protein Ahy_B01g053898 [Arachis hypogaea]|uniref:Uncharacterized protein n=1 Tax=Arachis hypogaea TaxID=3818 RepID=A0A445ASV3_ARAHY|nr:hypothetical protein Ahy_B01g053898 [Arachis hypogaea]
MELSADLKEKCYLWAKHIKTYEDGGTNESEPMCILNAQQPMQLSKIHFVSLKASTYIEAEIVTAMCLILNKQNIRRFEEQIYCLPATIVNIAIGNNNGGKFLHAKNKKPFDIQDYKMFIPYLDLKKLASHPSIFAPVCYGEHCWIWLADVRKKKFWYVISRMRVYAGGTSRERRS